MVVLLRTKDIQYERYFQRKPSKDPGSLERYPANVPDEAVYAGPERGREARLART
ncbi:hypothetical protein FRB98_006128 [Tulasnella sp. 332]|nr:hypothetical protein FRB98_006128 [Tulasnella sp. 332]